MESLLASALGSASARRWPQRITPPHHPARPRLCRQKGGDTGWAAPFWGRGPAYPRPRRAQLPRVSSLEEGRTGRRWKCNGERPTALPVARRCWAFQVTGVQAKRAPSLVWGWPCFEGPLLPSSPLAGPPLPPGPCRLILFVAIVVFYFCRLSSLEGVHIYLCVYVPYIGPLYSWVYAYICVVLIYGGCRCMCVIDG